MYLATQLNIKSAWGEGTTRGVFYLYLCGYVYIELGVKHMYILSYSRHRKNQITKLYLLFVS